MIQGFYSAATGAQQQMLRLGVHGNNIANVNNYGFKAEKPAFGDLMYNTVTGVDDAQLPKGTGTRMIATATDFSTSEITPTGRDQDYAILGEGFFALYDPSTQEISFTRDGAFTVNSFQETNENGEPELVWYLTDGEGRQVMNTEGYPIVVTDPTAEQPVGVFLIQYKDGLQHVNSGRFLTTDKNGAVWVSTSGVRQGYLETSNTDLAYEMSKVIESQRAYTYALRMVTTADEVETTINNLTN
ncbi:MAG TPA: flagellar hook basal-body protein [Candidatus Flavonifractor merdigallinarum]|mgnify:CR=1 FL=1|uniref:Flagellar hook basal-body protein n=1 Tax=Candidatus Flavonifractor merdigallinarum TaxID=2838589 RepID=A0A9D2BZ43_9FIRM|nr:flagellar hook basal-body protein [Candidatus Flavonifractor merdigallinarum]